MCGTELFAVFNHGEAMGIPELTKLLTSTETLGLTVNFVLKFEGPNWNVLKFLN